jgi:hypothetical protein
MDRHRCTAGVYQHTTTFRLAEVAGSAMHSALGIVDRTFGVDTARRRATPWPDDRRRLLASGGRLDAA